MVMRWIKNFISRILKTTLTPQATRANQATQATENNQTTHHFVNHVTRPNQFQNLLQNQFQNWFQSQFQKHL